MKTYSAKPQDIERRWYIIDAEGLILGRLATQVATILRGKHKPIFTPHMDCGDYVIVINVDKIRVTGNRLEDKFYYRHSGYPGGLSKRSLREVLEKQPERAITQAVQKMLPKGALGRNMLKKLRVYAGSEHPHTAQQPEVLDLRPAPESE